MAVCFHYIWEDIPEPQASDDEFKKKKAGKQIWAYN